MYLPQFIHTNKMENRSTIQLPKELISDLKKLKIYKRETYEEIIRKLINNREAKNLIKNTIKKDRIKLGGK